MKPTGEEPIFTITRLQLILLDPNIRFVANDDLKLVAFYCRGEKVCKCDEWRVIGRG